MANKKENKILCIDDTPTVRRLVQRLLGKTYTVLEAKDGLQGIDVATAQRPDLILVDLHMPHLTGYEVTTRLKSLLPQVPVVALTADVTAHVRERALASGCDGYLSKPIDPDDFPNKVAAFLAGEREQLEDNSFIEAYQKTLVTRLEQKVRALTEALEENTRLNRQNKILLERAQHRARRLEASARVSRSITSILDLDVLLNTTVDLICEEFNLPYATIYLLDADGTWAELRASHTAAPPPQRVRAGTPSPVGEAIWLGVARRSNTNQRPELTLPLTVGGEVRGVLSVHGKENANFTDEDVTALQAMADQLAIAINNARLLADLEEAHAELVRTKTFEAIATATGEAIHWVGNKAAPIPGSVARVREDVARYLVIAQAAALDGAERYAPLLTAAVEALSALGVDVKALQKELDATDPDRLQRLLSVDSIFEDLSIVENSAEAILNIKEDLIGPARKQRVRTFALADLLRETVASMGLNDVRVTFDLASGLPPVHADRVQLQRVFNNLIKNAVEAMESTPEPHLHLATHPAEQRGLVVAEVTDNGTGIPEADLDKIWMAFYTTKGDQGGTGLGLPACAQIVGELGGKITVESEVGVGTTFSVWLPGASTL
jgi:signal transduction histidine kinase